MLDRLKKTGWNLISSGLPSDNKLEVLSKFLIINILLIIGSITLLVMGFLALGDRNILLAVGDFFMLAFLFVSFILLRITKKLAMISHVAVVLIGLFFLFMISTGGVQLTAYLWSLTYPLAAIFLLGLRKGSWLSLLFLFLIILYFPVSHLFENLADYPMVLFVRLIAVYLIIFFLTLVLERIRGTTQTKLSVSNQKLHKTVGELEKKDQENVVLIQRLKEKIEEIEILQGIIPMCSNCKKIRNDKGFWDQVENYIEQRSTARFTHGICPECIKDLYPEYKHNNKKKGTEE